MVSASRGMRWVTTFGLGNMRPASGTWGSLPPAIVGGAMVIVGVAPVREGMWSTVGLAAWLVVMIAFALIFSWACIAKGDEAEAHFGKDPSCVVADETAGMGLTLALMPWGFIDRAAFKWEEACVFARWSSPALIAISAAFVLFRIMDIIKPWPAHGLQRVPGGWGVLLDDLFAGLYAAGVLWLAGWWLAR